MKFQIFLSLLIIIAIIRLFVQFYKKRINPFFFSFFLVVWCVVFFLNWNSAFIRKIGHLLGLERGINFLVYVGLFLVFYYVFVSTIKFYKLERDIDKLVKKSAIDDFLKRYNSKHK